MPAKFAFPIIGLLVLLFAGCFYELAQLSLESAAASQEVQIFIEAQNKALASETGEAVEQLKHMISHYPSGSKLRKGSKHDRIVEAVRSNVVQRILIHLQSTTGQNHGNDPQKWIDSLNDQKAQMPRNPSVTN